MKHETFRLRGGQAFPLEGTAMYSRDGKALEQAAQRGWAMPILEGFQQQSGGRTEKPCLTSPLTML